MHKFIKKRGVHIMRKFLVLVLSLAFALSLALTMGCKKAEEKAGEMKETATEKAGEMKEKAAEKAGDLKAQVAEKAGDLKEKAAEKAGDVKEKAAGWDACKGCHADAGKPAPSKADLLKKFKTEKELISAAKASKNSMMSNFKKDDLLKAAAKDLGLK
jgi:cytochrome c553